MNKTRELIRDEQVARDANVNEYLRLSAQADKQQQTRLKVTTRFRPHHRHVWPRSAVGDFR